MNDVKANGGIDDINVVYEGVMCNTLPTFLKSTGHPWPAKA